MIKRPYEKDDLKGFQANLETFFFRFLLRNLQQ